MGDEWHEFFKDFPDLDPANSHLSDAELAAKGAPGWQWVEEADARAAAQREQAAHGEGTDTKPALPHDSKG